MQRKGDEVADLDLDGFVGEGHFDGAGVGVGVFEDGVQRAVHEEEGGL